MKVVCPMCGASFVHQHGLDVHLMKPHVPCPECGKAYVGFIRHRRQAHQLTPEQRQARNVAISEGMRRRHAAKP